MRDALRGPRATLWLSALLPAAAAAACYANTLPNGFVYDDAVALGLIAAWKAQWTQLAFRTFDLAYSGRFLAYALHAIDNSLWGSWAPGFHLTNLLLHAVASALAGIAGFVLTRKAAAALLCGLLFAVHPVHVEAVALFVNRKDILAMIFIAPALLLWLDERQRWTRWIASLGFVGLAFLSKEVAAAGFVPMLLLADLLLRREPLPQRLRSAAWRWLPFAIGGLVVGALFLERILGLFEPGSIHNRTEAAVHAYSEVLATSAAALPDVFRLLLFPVTLAADYPPPRPSGWTDPRLLLGLGLLAGWVAGALALARRAPLAAFAMLWVVIVYLPCSNAVPLVHFFVAERYLYVPSFGVCLLAGITLDAALARARGLPLLRWVALALAAALVLACAGRTVARNRDWRSTEMLARSALAAGIETWRMNHLLGIVMLERRQMGTAEKHLRRAVELHAGIPMLHYDLAATLAYQGRMQSAREHVRRGKELITGGRLSRRGLYVLGPPSILRAGFGFLVQEHPELAAEQLRDVLALDDHQPFALLGLAWLSAASTRDQLRDGDEALRLAQRAAEALPEEMRAHALLVQAAAWAEAGDFDRARERAVAARKGAAAAGRSRLAAQADALRARLDARRPLRMSGREIHEMLRL